MTDESQAPTVLAAAQPAAKLWGLIVTFHRADTLVTTLAQIAAQSRPVDCLVVVDNGSDRGARAAAEAAGAVYVDSGSNLGPAGGISTGMKQILTEAGDDDWLVLFDDDDPPRTLDVLERLWDFGHRRRREDDRTAAVGMVGARYDFRRGITRRVRDAELQGPVAVDYIGGGQIPMFRCAVLREVGVFDERLFFGFDDLEHGLRLRGAGYSQYVDGEVWMAEREFHQRTGLDGSRLRTSREVAAWRRYYSVRNAVLIARTHCGLPTAVVVAAGGFRSAAALARSRRPLSEWFLPVRGALHGLRGRTGRRVEPGQNPAKNRAPASQD